VDATSQLSEKRLAVVKGPAGFGKTSLAVTWLQRLQQSGNAVAWLTIDTDDDEPAIFLFYLAHALQHASEGVGATAIDLIQESFLINPRAIALVPSDMKLLHEKTEGWPAALRIVVSTSIQSRQGIAQYVRKLSGSQRPIGAYLEDMLDGLPRDMVQFMLRTAILDRLCAPLCEALAGAVPGLSISRKLRVSCRSNRKAEASISSNWFWARSDASGKGGSVRVVSTTWQ
jgi:LuxR family maltose regulon positive regulatory protein